MEAGLTENKHDLPTLLFVLLVIIQVIAVALYALLKAVLVVLMVVLAVALAFSVLTAFCLLRCKANNESGIYNPRTEEVQENFQMEPVDNQLYISSDDPGLSNVHNVRHQHVTNTGLQSISRDNQAYQMQVHNDRRANGQRSCTYINRGVVSAVPNSQIRELNYSDITFNEVPTMRHPVIHGNVDRTIYSEIDLMADPVAPLSSSEGEYDESDDSDT